jgi:hypothetical protein
MTNQRIEASDTVTFVHRKKILGAYTQRRSAVRIISKSTTKMIAEIETAEYPAIEHHPAVSLKPKRRFKYTDLARPEPKPILALRPVFSATRRGDADRMKRSGRPNLVLRRVIAPTEFSSAMPQLPKSPLRRRVIDFLHLWQFGNHGIGRGLFSRQRVTVSR